MTIGKWRERPWGTPWQGDQRLIAAAEGITEIGLRRGMCYGPCPVYAVTLRRSGDARFDGEYFVDLVGQHRARIDRSAFDDLTLAAAYLGFDSFARNYAVDYTDQASTTTWIVRGDKRHEVEDYGGAGPDRLHRLEELIDEAASELGWQPVGQSKATGDEQLVSGAATENESRAPKAGESEHWTQRGERQR